MKKQGYIKAALLVLVGVAVLAGTAATWAKGPRIVSSAAPSTVAENTQTEEIEDILPTRFSQVSEMPVPAAPTHPNLVPDWENPIVVSAVSGTRSDTEVGNDSGAFVDIAVQNLSLVDSRTPFFVDIYLDSQRIHRVQFSGNVPGGAVLKWDDWAGMTEVVQLSRGLHTLRMVIDPENAVVEENEDDNVYERSFGWGPVSYSHIRYDETDLNAAIARFRSLLSVDTDDSTAWEHVDDVLQAADAGYYLLTGHSFRDEDVEILLLSHEEYTAYVDDVFDTRIAMSAPTSYRSIVAEREETKATTPGFLMRRFGRQTIAIDVQRPIGEVVGTLVHELGHVYQDLAASDHTRAHRNLYVDAAREAGAQQFERAFWLVIEEFSGESLLKYADTTDMRDFIDFQFAYWVRNAEQDEHNLGYLLTWLAVLNDPQLKQVKSRLMRDGRLNSADSLRLFEHLSSLDQSSIYLYVTERMGGLHATLETAKTLIRTRLDDNAISGTDNRERSALTVSNLLMP